MACLRHELEIPDFKSYDEQQCQYHHFHHCRPSAAVATAEKTQSKPKQKQNDLKGNNFPLQQFGTRCIFKLFFFVVGIDAAVLPAAFDCYLDWWHTNVPLDAGGIVVGWLFAVLVAVAMTS